MARAFKYFFTTATVVLTEKKRNVEKINANNRLVLFAHSGFAWNIVYSEQCEIFPQGETEVTQILARLNDNNGCSASWQHV